MKLNITTIVLLALLVVGCSQTVTPTAPESPCDPEIEDCSTDGGST